MNERSDRKLLDIKHVALTLLELQRRNTGVVAPMLVCCKDVLIIVNEIMSLSASTNSMIDAGRGLCCIISCAFVHVHVTITKTNRRNHFGI